MEHFLTWLKKPAVLLFFSAFFSALPLSFPSLFLLSWISFAPFFYLILKSAGEWSFRSALGHGLWFGFWYHFFVYFWFLWLYPLDFAGLSGLPAVAVILLAWPGISLIHGALFAIPSLLCRFLAKGVHSRSALAFAAILGILFAQRLTALSQLAFPWVKVSLGQYRATALIQSASLFGMEGLDFIILCVSACLALFFLSQGKRKVLSLGLAAVLFVTNFLFGVIRLALPEKEEESLTVSCIQGCILSGEKWASYDAALETYSSLTGEVDDEDVDLVVWPESAVPLNLATSPELLALYQSLSEMIGKPILMGCFWKDGSATTNSAVLLDEKSCSEPYSKQILVPFGERMPYRGVLSAIFPFLEEINMLSSDLAPGKDSALMELKGRKIGTVICFESIFPDLVRKSVRDGAEMLVIVTNDSWYEDSPAVWQHLAHATFRSVENGRSTVRCANSGVSAFIDEKGRGLSELGPLKQGVLTDTVSFSKESTLYSLLGDFVLPTGFAVLLGWLLVMKLIERKNHGGKR